MGRMAATTAQQQLIAILYARLYQRMQTHPYEALELYTRLLGQPEVTHNDDDSYTYTWRPIYGVTEWLRTHPEARF